MSDSSQGPGWWQASDGKWYPPEQQPGDQTTPATSPGSARDAKAAAKGEKARVKAMRPWYKKKRFVIPLVLIALIIIVAALGSGGDGDEDIAGDATSSDDAADTDSGESDDGASSDDGDTQNTALYPDRPDQQGEDHEAAVGESTRLAGYTATVHGAQLQTTPLDDQIVVVDVSLENRDDEAQQYNTFDWKIQTPNGQVLDPTFMGDNLGSGDLVSGGSVEGQVSFEVGPGTYYVIYKPDAFNAARGIWEITVE